MSKYTSSRLSAHVAPCINVGIIGLILRFAAKIRKVSPVFSRFAAKNWGHFSNFCRSRLPGGLYIWLVFVSLSLCIALRMLHSRAHFCIAICILHDPCAFFYFLIHGGSAPVDPRRACGPDLWRATPARSMLLFHLIHMVILVVIAICQVCKPLGFLQLCDSHFTPA